MSLLFLLLFLYPAISFRGQCEIGVRKVLGRNFADFDSGRAVGAFDSAVHLSAWDNVFKFGAMDRNPECVISGPLRVNLSAPVCGALLACAPVTVGMLLLDNLLIG